jgi:hypothetical protein
MNVKAGTGVALNACFHMDMQQAVSVLQWEVFTVFSF